eukprot:4029914-Alexandrium_andersonii.AAC.1
METTMLGGGRHGATGFLKNAHDHGEYVERPGAPLRPGSGGPQTRPRPPRPRWRRQGRSGASEGSPQAARTTPSRRARSPCGPGEGEEASSEAGPGQAPPRHAGGQRPKGGP